MSKKHTKKNSVKSSPTLEQVKVCERTLWNRLLIFFRKHLPWMLSGLIIGVITIAYQVNRNNDEDNRRATELINRAKRIMSGPSNSIYDLIPLTPKRQAELSDALVLINEAESIVGKTDQVYFATGLYLQLYGKCQLAENYYRKVIEKNPRCKDVYLNLANCLDNLGRMDEAEKYYNAHINIYPADAKGYYNLAVLVSKRNNYAMMAKLCEKATTLDPMNAEAWQTLGAAKDYLGFPVEALRAFERALEISPSLPQAHYSCTLVLYKLKRKADALTHLRTAINLRPATSRYYC